MADEPEGDRLYALSLDEFTKARDSLAARLGSAGDTVEAAQVKKLRKPTIPAWAVNQLARRQRPLVEELIAASERLRRAQQQLLQGGNAQNVWEATLAERDILSRLGHEAERILEAQGYGATRATLDRISDTLAAATAEPSGRTILRRGILTVEMRRAGFGGILGEDVTPDEEPVAAATTKTRPKEVLDAERTASRLAREAERAEADAERFERAAARAAEEVGSIKRRLAVAEKEATAARAEASAARKEATRARREADREAERHAKLKRARRGR